MNWNRLANAHRLKEPLREAVRMVLFEGATYKEAELKTGVNQGQLSRRLKRIKEAGFYCPCCGASLLKERT